MTSAIVNSDSDLLDLLRVAGPLDVKEMAGAIEVTATAVRQRLTRMMARGLIQREPIRAGRGRPRHRYHLTDRGLEQTGSNFTDLASALWEEVRSLRDPVLRRQLLERIARALAGAYRSQITGDTPAERMQSLSELLAKRRVPFSVETSPDGTPVLVGHACPYPRLAESDKDVCDMEALMFSELLGQDVKLQSCRREGNGNCEFRAG